jgi:hypothetical protein
VAPQPIQPLEKIGKLGVVVSVQAEPQHFSGLLASHGKSRHQRAKHFAVVGVTARRRGFARREVAVHIAEVVFQLQNLTGFLGVMKFGCRHGGTSPYRFWCNALYFKCGFNRRLCNGYSQDWEIGLAGIVSDMLWAFVEYLRNSVANSRKRDAAA